MNFHTFETSRYKKVTVDFETMGNTGKYYISFKNIRAGQATVTFLSTVTRRIQAIEHDKLFKSDAADKNFGIDFVRTSLPSYNMLAMRAFSVEINAINPPTNAFINNF